MKTRASTLLIHLCACLLLGVFGIAHAKQGGQSGGSAKKFAPGQQKKNAGSKGSAKQYAPGQRKKTAGTKGSTGSAKQYAPGQQKKNLAN